MEQVYNDYGRENAMLDNSPLIHLHSQCGFDDELKGFAEVEELTRRPRKEQMTKSSQYILKRKHKGRFRNMKIQSKSWSN